MVVRANHIHVIQSKPAHLIVQAPTRLASAAASEYVDPICEYDYEASRPIGLLERTTRASGRPKLPGRSGVLRHETATSPRREVAIADRNSPRCVHAGHDQSSSLGLRFCVQQPATRRHLDGFQDIATSRRFVPCVILHPYPVIVR
jgi:hypothetical protein